MNSALVKAGLLGGLAVAAAALLVHHARRGPPDGEALRLAIAAKGDWKGADVFLHRGFNDPRARDPDLCPVATTLGAEAPRVVSRSPAEAGYALDASVYYKGGGSLRLEAGGNGFALNVRGLDSAEVGLVFHARCPDGRRGLVRIGYAERDAKAAGGVSLNMKKAAEEVKPMWRRVIDGARFQERQKDLVVVVVNADPSVPVWLDDLSVRRRIVSDREIVTERTIYTMETLGLAYELLEADEAEARRADFSAVVVPYYEDCFTGLCDGGGSTPVYVVHCEPDKGGLPPAGILRAGTEVSYANLERKGYEYPFIGRFQTLDLKDGKVTPLLWKDGEPSEAVAWKYGTTTWAAFPANYLSYCYVFDRLVQDLGLVAAPFIFALDVDDINTPGVHPTDLARLAAALRERDAITHLGVKPEHLRYLEPDQARRAASDPALARELAAEREQVAAILDNADVFLPVLHAHGGTKWTAPSEAEQAEAYLGLLEKLRRYGFDLGADSFGYMYCPCNEFNKVATAYLPKVGVHVLRVCIETAPVFDNRYDRIGPLALVPSSCPLNANMRTVAQSGLPPLEFYAQVRWNLLDGIFNRRVLFLHGDNFMESEMGLKILADISSLVDDTGIVIPGTPFDLRDKYARPFRITGQRKIPDGLVLEFDRELRGEKLVSPARPVRRAVDEHGNGLVLFSSYILCGFGSRLELRFEADSAPPAPFLRKISGNAFLTYAVHRKGAVTMELEGYGKAAIVLENLEGGRRYTVRHAGPEGSGPAASFPLAASAAGDLSFSVELRSSARLDISPAE